MGGGIFKFIEKLSKDDNKDRSFRVGLDRWGVKSLSKNCFSGLSFKGYFSYCDKGKGLGKDVSISEGISVDVGVNEGVSAGNEIKFKDRFNIGRYSEYVY
jgi:hypothetical protein